MKRKTEGTIIVVGAVLGIACVLAVAVAWGQDNECVAQFPKVIGCALASYEGLSGGLIAAGGALFAGWLAWSAARDQIALEKSNAHEVRKSRAKQSFTSAEKELKRMIKAKKNAEHLRRILKKGLADHPHPYATALLRLAREKRFPTSSVDWLIEGMGHDLWEGVARMRAMGNDIHRLLSQTSAGKHRNLLGDYEGAASEAAEEYMALVQEIPNHITKQRERVASLKGELDKEKEAHDTLIDA